MKRTRNYGCTRFEAEADKPLKITRYDVTDGWPKFVKQVKKWIRTYGIKDAEERFVLNYLPEFKVADPEDLGALTDGLLLEYQGTIYWDESYAIESFLDKLLCTGEASLWNAGQLENEVNDEQPTES